VSPITELNAPRPALTHDLPAERVERGREPADGIQGPAARITQTLQEG
jgi:hypothetical protein